MKVHSGPGARGSSPFDVIWTNATVWNNKGDTAVLFGANGHEIARLSTGSGAPDSKREMLLYRSDGEMYIEGRKPYKDVNRGWADPESDKDPEEHRG
jgi:hypothetical protein